MNCDLCTYRVRLPGYEDKVGTPISLTPHGDGPARGGAPRAARDARAPGRARDPPRAGAAAGARGRRRPRDAAGARRARAALRLSRRHAGARRASILRSRRASGSRCSAPTARARRRSRCSSAGCWRAATGDGRASAAIELGATTRRELRRRVGIVFQDPDDQLFMPTVEADVAFGPANLGLRGDALRARVDEALDARRAPTELADRAPHALSAGQRRRAAMAGVLAMPARRAGARRADSSRLDPAARRELADVLVSLRLTHAAGHPRPPLRARAVPARGRARPRPGRRRRRRRARCSPTRASCARTASSCPPASTRWRMTGTLHIVGLGPGGAGAPHRGGGARGRARPTSSIGYGALRRPVRRPARRAGGRARARWARSRARRRGARAAPPRARGWRSCPPATRACTAWPRARSRCAAELRRASDPPSRSCPA